MAKRLKFRMFDKFAVASCGGTGHGFINSEDGAPLDLSDFPGIKRLFVSFALAGNSKVQITKTRDAVTKTTILKNNDTLTAHYGIGPIAVPVSELDTFDFEAVSDVGLDWILIEASYKAEE